MTYLKKNSNILNLIFLLLSVLITEIIFIIDFFNKKATTVTLMFFLLFLIYVFFTRKHNFIYEHTSIKSTFFIFVCFLIYLFVSQNYYLQFETITWDVSSYLVASQGIDLSNLPFEKQWESKGPILIYIYKALIVLSSGNYVVFKLLNDFVLFLVLIILFFIVNRISNKNRVISVSSCFLFISIFSVQWYVSEFSELYCLFFIGLANHIYLKKNSTNRKYTYGIVAFLIAISTLINQGSVLFLLPFVVLEFKNFDKKSFFQNLKYSLFGFLLPHLLFVLIYFVNDLLGVYYANYVSIPIGYTGENASSFYELRVYSREIFEFNLWVYLSIVLLFFLLIYEKINFKLLNINLIELNLIVALLYYFVAGHNYYHHLMYFVFFLCALVGNLKIEKNINLMLLFVLFTTFNISYNSANVSYSNLTNYREIYDEYPLKNLASEIDSYFVDKEYSVFALDYVLLLFYLEKVNYSYIVHPTNHFQPYIVDPLINLGLVEDDEVVKIFESEPDVIICNTMAIDNGGNVIFYDPANYGDKIIEGADSICKVSEYNDKYFQIDTKSFRENKLLTYYYDPYKDMNVYIKISPKVKLEN